jgi:hypothetical protein
MVHDPRLSRLPVSVDDENRAATTTTMRTVKCNCDPTLTTSVNDSDEGRGELKHDWKSGHLLYNLQSILHKPKV